MKTIETTELVTVTGGIATNTAATRPGLQNPADRWSIPSPKLPLPKPQPTMPLGPFVPDQSQRQIA
jgi:hypothetical protein